jgi:dUTPase
MPVYRFEVCPTVDGHRYYAGEMNRSTENAGYDLFVCKEYNVWNMQYPALLDLGCSARMVRIHEDGREEEVHYWLSPRSSIYKTGLIMANSMGVIDRSYRGTLKAPVWCIDKITFQNNFAERGFEGTRLFQVLAPDMGHINEVRIVDYLPNTTRGEGGFGSTGR